MQDVLQQILYFFGHGFCHQYPERSFEVGGLHFCVCARCTGIYLGFILTLVVLLIIFTRVRNKPTTLPPMWVVVVCIMLALPMVIDGVSSYLGLRETNNLLRYFSGYLTGTSLAVLVGGGVYDIISTTVSAPLSTAASTFTPSCRPARPAQPDVAGPTCIFSNIQVLQHFASQNAQDDSGGVNSNGSTVVGSRTVSTPYKPSGLSTILVASSAAGVAFYVLYPYLGLVAPFLILACLWLAAALVVLLVVSTTRFWAGNSTRRLLLALLCVLLAGVAMAVMSLFASGLGLLFPWYTHP